MTLFRTSVSLLLGTILLANLPALANPRKAHKKPLATPQIPFSFIAPSQPSPSLSRLQGHIQGRIVEQVEQRQAPPAQPIYTQIFPAASASTQIQPAISTHSTANTAPLAETPAQPPSPPKAKQNRPMTFDYTERSWVSDLTAPQAIPLAANIADFLAKQFDPETTTLLLATPDKKQLNNPLTPELETRLHQAGFTLAATLAQAPQAQLVQYQVNALDTGILVQLHTPHQWVSRYYPFTATQALMATHPFSIRTLGGITP